MRKYLLSVIIILSSLSVNAQSESDCLYNLKANIQMVRKMAKGRNL